MILLLEYFKNIVFINRITISLLKFVKCWCSVIRIKQCSLIVGIAWVPFTMGMGHDKGLYQIPKLVDLVAPKMGPVDSCKMVHRSFYLFFRDYKI